MRCATTATYPRRRVSHTSRGRSNYRRFQGSYLSFVHPHEERFTYKRCWRAIKEGTCKSGKTGGNKEYGYTHALMPLPSPSELQSDLTREVELNVYINSYRKLQPDITFGVLEHKWDMIKRRYLFTTGVLLPTQTNK